MADGKGAPPAFPTWGQGAAGGGGYGGSSYTPQPYGSSYADQGLVYGLGAPNTFWTGGTGSLAAIAGASRFKPQSMVELGRAANWITGTLASEGDKQKYQGYFKRFFPQGGSFEQYGALWSNAAQYAAQVNRDDPNARWSPWDALEKMWNLYSKSGGGAGGGGTSFSSVSRSVNLTGKDESDATLDQALSNLLGRTATDAEKKQFLSSLNAAERANPTVQRSSGTTSAGGASTSSSTTQSTSVNAGARAQKFAEGEKGFAEYQYATTYMDAMLEALNSPVRM
jgi:hypothetical protein